MSFIPTLAEDVQSRCLIAFTVAGYYSLLEYGRESLLQLSHAICRQHTLSLLFDCRTYHVVSKGHFSVSDIAEDY
jgi:hypothetical protein